MVSKMQLKHPMLLKKHESSLTHGIWTWKNWFKIAYNQDFLSRFLVSYWMPGKTGLK